VMSFPDNPLGALAEQPNPREWVEAATLRRIAGRRRLRGRVAASTISLVAVTAALFIAWPGHDNGPAQLQPGVRVASRHGAAYELIAAATSPAPVDRSAAGPVARAEQDFTFALLTALNRDGGDKNTVVSPSSLALALAMLQTGATGKTATEIARALRTESLTSARQDQGWQALTDDLTAAAAKDGFALESANSLWVQQGKPMEPAFMTAMQQYFNSGVWQVNFAADPAAAVKAFNAWVSDRTHGKITQLLEKQQVEAAVTILANATYFKAAWAIPFDEQSTREASFETAPGRHVQAPFLNSSAAFAAASTPAYDAVQLPYQSKPQSTDGTQTASDLGGRYAALVVMPKTRSLNDFVATLDGPALDRITSSVQRDAAGVSMPKFDLSDSNDLRAPLKSLGITAAFGPAELGGMFPHAGPGDYYVSQVVQKATLKVDEAGSEASAATAIVIVPTSIGPPIITFNHPFLFLIRDTQTGTILFAAEIRNPTQ